MVGSDLITTKHKLIMETKMTGIKTRKGILKFEYETLYRINGKEKQKIKP